MRPLVAFLIVALGACCPRGGEYGVGQPAREATSAQERTVAMRRFGEGVAAYERRRYDEAIERFQQADRVATSPAFAYNIALAFERKGDDAQALRWSREYLRRDPGAQDRAELEVSIREYERRLAERGLMQVTITSSPVGASLAIDGEPVGVTPWTGEMAPGPHILDVMLPGRGVVRRSFDLAADRAIDVHVDMVAARR
jgi:hypothetical protein